MQRLASRAMYSGKQLGVSTGQRSQAATCTPANSIQPTANSKQQTANSKRFPESGIRYGMVGLLQLDRYSPDAGA